MTVFDDEGTATPDSVFPNNWLSTHADGTLVLYPMYAANRRAERRADMVAHLREHYAVERVVDCSGAEREGRFLEGTGAMVLDHVTGIAYACRSRRLDPSLFETVCADLGYASVLFEASDPDGVPVYHTNVLMSVGTELALVGAEMIRDADQRTRVLESLRRSGREVLELTEPQVHGFLGNCLEVLGEERLLVMSAQAAAQLTPRSGAGSSAPAGSSPHPCPPSRRRAVRCAACSPGSICPSGRPPRPGSRAPAARWFPPRCRRALGHRCPARTHAVRSAQL